MSWLPPEIWNNHIIPFITRELPTNEVLHCTEVCNDWNNRILNLWRENSPKYLDTRNHIILKKQIVDSAVNQSEVLREVYKWIETLNPDENAYLQVVDPTCFEVELIENNKGLITFKSCIDIFFGDRYDLSLNNRLFWIKPHKLCQQNFKDIADNTSISRDSQALFSRPYRCRFTVNNISFGIETENWHRGYRTPEIQIIFNEYNKIIKKLDRLCSEPLKYRGIEKLIYHRLDEFGNYIPDYLIDEIRERTALLQPEKNENDTDRYLKAPNINEMLETFYALMDNRGKFPECSDKEYSLLLFFLYKKVLDVIYDGKLELLPEIFQHVTEEKTLENFTYIFELVFPGRGAEIARQYPHTLNITEPLFSKIANAVIDKCYFLPQPIYKRSFPDGGFTEEEGLEPVSKKCKTDHQ